MSEPPLDCELLSLFSESLLELLSLSDSELELSLRLESLDSLESPESPESPESLESLLESALVGLAVEVVVVVVVVVGFFVVVFFVVLVVVVVAGVGVNSVVL